MHVNEELCLIPLGFMALGERSEVPNLDASFDCAAIKPVERFVGDEQLPGFAHTQDATSFDLVSEEKSL